ncbi:MAG: AEC family transporter, partial [Elusimicrobiota bacterium]
LLLCSALGNTVYLGFPLTAMRFGEDAVSTASVVTSVQNLTVFTAGFAALALATGQGKGQAGKVLGGNILLWSSVLGGTLAFLGIRLHGPLEKMIALLGSGAAPLALFSLGMFLHGKPLGRRPWAVARLCAFKLLVFPALFLVCAKLFSLRGPGAGVSLLESLMPLAVTNFVLAQKLGLDEELVAESILASTLASIPILLAFDRLLALVN